MNVLKSSEKSCQLPVIPSQLRPETAVTQFEPLNRPFSHGVQSVAEVVHSPMYVGGAPLASLAIFAPASQASDTCPASSKTR